MCDCVNSNTCANTHTCVREVPSGWYGGWRKPPYAPIFLGMLPLPPIFLWGQPPQTASVFLSARLRVLLNFFKNFLCWNICRKTAMSDFQEARLMVQQEGTFQSALVLWFFLISNFDRISINGFDSSGTFWMALRISLLVPSCVLAGQKIGHAIARARANVVLLLVFILLLVQG